MSNRGDGGGYSPHPGDPWHPGWSPGEEDGEEFVAEHEARERTGRGRRWLRRRRRREEEPLLDAVPIEEDEEAHDQFARAAEGESLAPPEVYNELRADVAEAEAAAAELEERRQQTAVPEPEPRSDQPIASSESAASGATLEWQPSAPSTADPYVEPAAPAGAPDTSEAIAERDAAEARRVAERAARLAALDEATRLAKAEAERKAEEEAAARLAELEAEAAALAAAAAARAAAERAEAERAAIRVEAEREAARAEAEREAARIEAERAAARAEAVARAERLVEAEAARVAGEVESLRVAVVEAERVAGEREAAAAARVDAVARAERLVEAEAARVAGEVESLRVAVVEAERVAGEREAAAAARVDAVARAERLVEAEAARVAGEVESLRVAVVEAERIAGEREAAAAARVDAVARAERLVEAEAARVAGEVESLRVAVVAAERIAAEREAARLEAERLIAEQTRQEAAFDEARLAIEAAEAESAALLAAEESLLEEEAPETASLDAEVEADRLEAEAWERAESDAASWAAEEMGEVAATVIEPGPPTLLESSEPDRDAGDIDVAEVGTGEPSEAVDGAIDEEPGEAEWEVFTTELEETPERRRWWRRRSREVSPAVPAMPPMESPVEAGEIPKVSVDVPYDAEDDMLAAAAALVAGDDAAVTGPVPTEIVTEPVPARSWWRRLLGLDPPPRTAEILREAGFDDFFEPEAGSVPDAGGADEEAGVVAEAAAVWPVAEEPVGEEEAGVVAEEDAGVVEEDVGVVAEAAAVWPVAEEPVGEEEAGVVAEEDAGVVEEDVGVVAEAAAVWPVAEEPVGEEAAAVPVGEEDAALGATDETPAAAMDGAAAAEEVAVGPGPEPDVWWQDSGGAEKDAADTAPEEVTAADLVDDFAAAYAGPEFGEEDAAAAERQTGSRRRGWWRRVFGLPARDDLEAAPAEPDGDMDTEYDPSTIEPDTPEPDWAPDAPPAYGEGEPYVHDRLEMDDTLAGVEALATPAEGLTPAELAEDVAEPADWAAFAGEALSRDEAAAGRRGWFGLRKGGRGAEAGVSAGGSIRGEASEPEAPEPDWDEVAPIAVPDEPAVTADAGPPEAPPVFRRPGTAAEALQEMGYAAPDESAGAGEAPEEDEVASERPAEDEFNLDDIDLVLEGISEERYYRHATTQEHVGLAEAVADSAEEGSALLAMSAALPGIDSGVVGFEDVTDHRDAIVDEDPGEDEEMAALMAEQARPNLGIRILTGLILIGVFLGALRMGSTAVIILLLVVLLVALGEFYAVLVRFGYQPLSLFGFLGGAGAVLAVRIWGIVAVPGALLVTIVAVFFLYAMAPERRRPLENGALTVAAMAWVAGFGAFAVPIIEAEEFRILVLSLVALTVIMDVGQYFVGTEWGHRKLAPVLSPKKTVEGLIGGAILTMAAGFAIGRIEWFDPFEVSDGLILAAAVAVSSVVGDLSVSMVKRSVGVKDMGGILPGHGGLLDRIDGLLFSIPAAWLVFRWLGLLL